MLKVVIDTNLLINASKDDFSYGNRIVEAVIAGKIEAYANPATLKENRLLAAKTVSDKEYLKKLVHFFSRVKVIDYLEEPLDVVADSEDNKLVESAVAADADYLISSDHHLLTLGSYGVTQIVSPEQFWNAWQDEEGSGWPDWVKSFIK